MQRGEGRLYQTKYHPRAPAHGTIFSYLCTFLLGEKAIHQEEPQFPQLQNGNLKALFPSVLNNVWHVASPQQTPAPGLIISIIVMGTKTVAVGYPTASHPHRPSPTASRVQPFGCGQRDKVPLLKLSFHLWCENKTCWQRILGSLQPELQFVYFAKGLPAPSGP